MYVAIPACGFTHGAPTTTTETGSDAHVVDDAAVATGDAPLPCGGETISDSFTDTTPCMAWGSENSLGATILGGAGSLQISPMAFVAGTHAGCTQTGSAALPTYGIFIEVTSAVTGTTSYTNFHAFTATVGAASAAFLLQAGALSVFDDAHGFAAASASYDPVAMKWWRLRPDADGVAGDVSPDGRTWTELGIVPGAVPAAVRVDFGAGTVGAEQSPGTTTFRAFDICP